MVHEVDLVSAAARLRVSWHKAYRYVLTGRLKGERREGRWFVDADSLNGLESREVEPRETSTPD